MRDPQRIDRMIELLRAVWHRSPDLRLNQLIFNFAPPDSAAAFYQDDDATEDRLRRRLAEVSEETSRTGSEG